MSATVTQGFDLYVQSGVSTPPDLGLDQAVLATDTVYLALFPEGAPDLVTLISDVFSLYPVGSSPGGVTLSLDLITAPWAPSTVTYATKPATLGAPVTVTFPAFLAGHRLDIDLTALAQKWSDGSQTNYGIAITRTDDGNPLSVWTYQAAALQPFHTVSYRQPPPVPTRLSPSGARAVSVAQVLLRVLDYPAGLGDVTLIAMRVQWSASTDFTTPLADDTLETASAEFDMTKTASGFAIPTSLVYWHTQLQASDGSWSDWSDPAGTYLAPLGNLILVTPPAPPDNVTNDIDPPIQWTFSGTQAFYRATRTTLADPLTLLGDTEKQPGAATAAYVNAPVPDSQTYVDTVTVWDNIDREDIPGAPAYVQVSQQWLNTDGSELSKPDLKPLTQYAGMTPFVVVQWALNGGDGKQFRVKRDGAAISGLLDPSKVKIGTDDQGKPLYQWVDFTASPNTEYSYRVQVLTGSKGNATSDPGSVVTTAVGAWLARPSDGTLVRLLNADVGEWDLTEPTSTWWAPFTGSFRWRRVRGQRLGYSTQVTAEIWPDSIEPAAKSYHQNFLAMNTADEDLVLATPHETVTVQISDISSTPISNPLLGRTVKFTARQTGDSYLSGNQGQAGGQGTLTRIDFDTYPAGLADGDAIVTDDMITKVSGTVAASSDAAMHGSSLGCKITSTDQGAYLGITTNRYANTWSIYSLGVSALPSASKNLIRWTSAGGTVATIVLATSGSLKIQDNSGTTQDQTTAQIDVGQQFRLMAQMQWDTGQLYLTGLLFIGDNMEGDIPDAQISAQITAAAAPDGEVDIGTESTAGFDWLIDDIQVLNNTSAWPPVLGTPPPPPEPPDGVALWAGGFDQTSGYLTAYVQGTDSIPISDSDLVGVQVATDAGFSNVVWTGTAAVRDEVSFRKWQASGLSAGTTYHWRITQNGTPIYTPGVFMTKFAVDVPIATLKIASGGCQKRNPCDPHAFQDIVAWGPHRMVHHGDRAYPYYLDSTIASHAYNHADTSCDPSSQLVCLAMAQDYLISDHDVNAGPLWPQGNGDNFNDPVTRASLDCWAQVVPMPIADTRSPIRGRYCAIPEGRYHNVYLDYRTLDRSAVANNGVKPDDPDTTLLGSVQEDWLKQQATIAAANHRLLVLWTDSAWDGETPVGYHGADGIAVTFSDKVPSYSKTRDRIEDMLYPICGDNVLIIFSDSHAIQWSDGTGNRKGYVTICSGPLNQTVHAHFQAFYSDSSGNDHAGTYPPDTQGDGTQESGGDPNGITRNAMQYNRITFADTGTTITVTVEARDCTPSVAGTPKTVHTLTKTYTP